MSTHPSEALAEEQFRKALTNYIRAVVEGVSDEELKKQYSKELAFPIGSFVAHLTSDWAEHNLQTYISSTAKEKNSMR